MNKEDVKQTAIEMAAEVGLINLSRRDLCERAGIPDGSFPHVMGCTFSEFVVELQDEGFGAGMRGEIVEVNKTRVSPKLRREQILAAAVELAKTDGYRKMTRDDIAKRAGVSTGLVTKYFSTMPALRRDVMRAAVRNNVAEVVAQGLANRCSHAMKASPELKKQAALILVNS